MDVLGPRNGLWREKKSRGGVSKGVGDSAVHSLPYTGKSQQCHTANMKKYCVHLGKICSYLRLNIVN